MKYLVWLLALILGCSTAFADNSVEGRSVPRWVGARMATLDTVVQRIKNQPGMLGGYFIYNPNSTASYIHFYDTANTTGVTPGTVTPKWSIGVPATAGAHIEFANGMYFSSGIAVSASTAATGNTATVATIPANFIYR
jgi:hypothetical protein